MQKMFFLFALLITLQVSAEDAVRCGTDAFGNEVCMDKDGVVSPAPVKRAGNQSGAAAGENNKASRSSDESAVKPGDEEQTRRKRCGIDPFGNKVCQ
ncbi:MAG: hypothetical protein WAW02_05440 [Sideroxyarcus sp.]